MDNKCDKELHLSVRSIGHRSRIKNLVTMEARETAGVVDVLATCHLRGLSWLRGILEEDGN